MSAFHGNAAVGSISAMPVLIDYEATWGEFTLSKRGEEHVFRFMVESEPVEEGNYDAPWKQSPLNADAILDNFQDAKTPTEALDFLNKTGLFSMLSVRFSWSYFRRWQRFAYLVQEHELLASTMRSAQWEGECGEVLKALSGDQTSTFFTGSELQPFTNAQLDGRAQWLLDPKNAEQTKENQRIVDEERAELCAWFRQPPDKACSIEWIPKSDANRNAIDPLLEKGAMIEFLVPQEDMRPVLLIRPTNTLEAVAASIYADRIMGIEYRACEVCSELFELGSRGEKKYCSRERCKNTAHQRRMRANRAKALKLKATQTKGEPKQ